MTSLLEGARNLVTRGTDLGARIEGLQSAVDAGRGRLDPALLTQADEVIARASSRLRLSAEHTVVGIAGATGSGKSSTFNALTGLELSAVGVRRPTTSWATACVWGAEGADELLGWLGIPPRHQTTRDSMLDTRKEGNELDGVVLLDLPDHDSTEVTHHLEVDRLVNLVDLLVWVLDPQKYADAAIHDRYLAPLKTHDGVMVIVLNHIDTVPEDRRASMLADVRRLLDADGLQKVPVIAVSARQGIGIPELKTEIARRVSAKRMTRSRIESDLKAVAQRMDQACGTGRTGTLAPARVSALQDAFADSAGVPTVVDAVERSTRMRALRATGWPVLSWVSGLRPDPLRRLHLDLGAEGKELTGRARTSLPAVTPVQRARVDTEVRALADDTSAGMTPPWVEAVRRASVSHLPHLPDRLDRVLGETDLGVAGIPGWAGIVRLLQWLLIGVSVVGLVWSGALLVSGGLGSDSSPKVAGIALPVLLLIAGVVLGVALALLCRVLVASSARSRAAAARRKLQAGVDQVSRELVIDPVQTELTAYSSVRSGLAAALK